MSIKSLLEDLLKCEVCAVNECDGPDGICERCRLKAIESSPPVKIEELLQFSNLSPEEKREWDWLGMHGWHK